MKFPAPTFHRSLARLPVDRHAEPTLESAFRPVRALRDALAWRCSSSPRGVVTAFAQNVPVVRDAEIEALVRDYARPIFKAAGLRMPASTSSWSTITSFNAFVAGRRMFINTGALMQAETPNEIIGVIAHEAGHIAGGHQERLRDQLERAKTMAIIAALLGAGAIVAGAATSSGGLARPAPAWRPAAARWRSAACSATSAPRKPTADRSAHHLSRGDRPVGQGHAEDLPALPERAVAVGRAGRSLPDQPSDAAGAHRQSRSAGEAEPLFRQGRSAGAAAAPRHDARQDRRLHGGPGGRVAAVPQGCRAASPPIWRRPVDLSVSAIRRARSPRPTP